MKKKNTYKNKVKYTKYSYLYKICHIKQKQKQKQNIPFYYFYKQKLREFKLSCIFFHKLIIL